MSAQITVVDDSFGLDYKFAIFNINQDGDRVGECTLEFKDIDQYTCVENTARLTKEHAISLMDQLWLLGIRPSRTTSHEPALNAHLQDMRKIVSSRLKIDL